MWATTTNWARANPKMAAATIAYVVFEMSPFGPTGFFMRLPGKIAARQLEGEKLWEVFDSVVPVDCQSGDMMTVDNPHAPQAPTTVRIPEGKLPGETFRYKVRR